MTQPSDSVSPSFPACAFLGWARPLLPSVTDWLFEQHAKDGSWDLSNLVLAFPGQHAARRLLEILVLRAAAGTGEAADAAMRRALELAEPEGYVRIFLDEGEPVSRRVREMLDRPGALAPRLADYVRRLISFAQS